MKTISGKDFAMMQFEGFELHGDYGRFFGTLFHGVRMFIYSGLYGTGKSFFATSLGRAWVDGTDGEVVYVLAEEGLSKPPHDRISALGATSERIAYGDYTSFDAIKKDLKKRKHPLVILDSISKVDPFSQEGEAFLEWCAANDVSVAFIAQSTKQGQFRGSNRFPHEVDLVITIERDYEAQASVATIEKTRTGSSQMTMAVPFSEAQYKRLAGHYHQHGAVSDDELEDELRLAAESILDDAIAEAEGEVDEYALFPLIEKRLVGADNSIRDAVYGLHESRLGRENPNCAQSPQPPQCRAIFATIDQQEKEEADSGQFVPRGYHGLETVDEVRDLATRTLKAWRKRLKKKGEEPPKAAEMLIRSSSLKTSALFLSDAIDVLSGYLEARTLTRPRLQKICAALNVWALPDSDLASRLVDSRIPTSGGLFDSHRVSTLFSLRPQGVVTDGHFLITPKAKKAVTETWVDVEREYIKRAKRSGVAETRAKKAFSELTSKSGPGSPPNWKPLVDLDLSIYSPTTALGTTVLQVFGKAHPLAFFNAEDVGLSVFNADILAFMERLMDRYSASLFASRSIGAHVYVGSKDRILGLIMPRSLGHTEAEVELRDAILAELGDAAPRENPPSQLGQTSLFATDDEDDDDDEVLEAARANPTRTVASLGFLDSLLYSGHVDTESFGPNSVQAEQVFMFGEPDGSRLYLVPESRVSDGPAIVDASSQELYEMWSDYHASGQSFAVRIPQSLLVEHISADLQIGTALTTYYRSDKYMQSGDGKGVMNHYYHDHDRCQRPVFRDGDVLVVDKLSIDERGILN